MEEPYQIYQGIPCYLENIPQSPYRDSTNLKLYKNRFHTHIQKTYIYEKMLLPNAKSAANILSVGEGTGEVIASLAAKYPELNFFAFDYAPERVIIAYKLMNYLRLTNVKLYIGSVEWIPFPKNFFSAVIERGVFHILPKEVKLKNLAEIERVCDGQVVMSHMTNANMYIIVRWLQSKYYNNQKIWDDAIATYRNIDKECNNLTKMAKFVQAKTRHSVKTIYNFKQNREISYSTNHLTFFQYLGGLTYSTRH